MSGKQLNLKEFKEANEVNSKRWGGWPKVAWERDSIVLIAFDYDKGFVLDYDGAHIDYEMTEVGRDFSDLGLDPPDDGLWLWTGRLVSSSFQGYDGAEYESWPEGTFRRLTDEEAIKVAGGGCIIEPFDLNPDFCCSVSYAVKNHDAPVLIRLIERMQAEHLDEKACAHLIAEACGFETIEEGLEVLRKSQ